MECSINSPALSLLMKHLAIGQRPKTHNFSAFHWSPRGSLVSIGQHFVATRVVHVPKSTEISLITESDQSGPDHQLLQLCTDSTTWSDSDQAVRAVHSCNSWFVSFIEIWHAFSYLTISTWHAVISWYGLTLPSVRIIAKHITTHVITVATPAVMHVIL